MSANKFSERLRAVVKTAADEGWLPKLAEETIRRLSDESLAALLNKLANETTEVPLRGTFGDLVKWINGRITCDPNTCSGEFRETRKWCEENGLPIERVEKRLNDLGCHCDCEVMWNIAAVGEDEARYDEIPRPDELIVVEDDE